MMNRPWDTFYRQKITQLMSDKKSVVDIGGSLRIDRQKNNRFSKRNAWITDLIEEKGVEYKVLDYVDTYHPDIVGDAQDLPFNDNSQEALICLAVLEHVENPIKAAAELYRTLKPGGYCFVYVPFLYYYHAEKGYYGDYWRFTEDGLRSIFKPFASFEITNVRAPFETLIRLSPFGRFGLMCDFGYLVDRLTRKLTSKQTAGHYIFLMK